MKLSVEAKVASAVATGFVALALGAIAQANSAGQSGGVNNYGPANGLGVNSEMAQEGLQSDRGNAEQIQVFQ